MIINPKENLESLLEEISKVLSEHNDNRPNIGVLSGISGLSLFQFYYSMYKGDDQAAEYATELLVNCIEKINSGYSYPTFCDGITGFAWVVDHLEAEGFIELGDNIPLGEFDDYLNTCMLKDLNSGNYDFLHGAIGYAFYFLSRYRSTASSEKNKYKTFLLEFVFLLEKMSERDNMYFNWGSEQVDSKDIVYNLGLSHGLASIIGILSQLYEYVDFQSHVKSMLNGAIASMLKAKNCELSISCFPSWVSPSNPEPNAISRLAWCYGDLGIGLQLLFASRVLKDDELYDTAIDILSRSTARKEVNSTFIDDAGVCHGAFGIALVYINVYKETGIIAFKEAADLWITKGLDFKTYPDGLAGFKTLKIDKMVADESLLGGIAGIGLTIIDYLTVNKTNWGKCLMVAR